MKTYIVIPVTDGSDSRVLELNEVLNRIICTPVKKSINIYDLTDNGIGGEMKALLRSYARFGVAVHRVKRNLETINEKKNFGVTQSLIHFNIIHSKTYDTYVHIDQNVMFSAFDLQLLIDNARLFNAISPVVESVNGLEIWDAVFDRYGVTYPQKDNKPSFFVNGQIEESFALNPKCFALSARCAHRLKNFRVSDRNCVEWLNGQVYENANELPKIDNSLFVHENLY